MVVALAALAVGVDAITPGATLRSSPFPGLGSGSASSGPLTVEVHGAELASSIEVDGERRETTGAFVVLDVTIASREDVDLLDRDLVLDGRVYDASTKGPTAWQESHPAPGIPVRGDLVFEVDRDLVVGGAPVDLLVAPGFDAAGDLQPQVVVRWDVDGAIVDVVAVEALAR
ncbi:hypothetical protein C1N71_09575 [Agrococcus sp. SGAir0287]|nr:hypothetical protein C1N71_09575 [Agrococcus sp. SGAir0287]